MKSKILNLDKFRQELLEKSLDPNHSNPVTRRQFLANGLISGGAFLTFPSLLNFLSSRAHGQSNGCLPPSTAVDNNRFVPMIIIDASGGANFAGANIAVGGRRAGSANPFAGDQLQFLENRSGQNVGGVTIDRGPYASIGLPSSMAYGASGITVNQDYGIAFHPSSPFLAGMNEVVLPAQKPKVDGVIVCTSTENDTADNGLMNLYYLPRFGRDGRLASFVGTRPGLAGGVSRPAVGSYSAAHRPTFVRNASSARNLLSVTRLVDTLNQSKAEGVLRQIERWSSDQLSRFQELNLSDQTRSLAECGYLGTHVLASSGIAPSQLDPRLDSKLKGPGSLFGGTVNPAAPEAFANTNDDKVATVCKLVFEGWSGGGVIEVGGYDYHNVARADTDSRDRNLGRMVGQVLDLARRYGTDVMLYVYTDGSVSVNSGDLNNTPVNWASDDSSTSAVLSFFYDHRYSRAQRSFLTPDYAQGRQVGWFSSVRSGTAENAKVDRKATPISDNPDMVAKFIFLNYLALHGREGELNAILGEAPFTNQDISRLIFFEARSA
jgi:hypothetical protein